MNKDIYPENIENDPLESTDNDLQGVGMDQTVYTLKAGQTFVEKKKFSDGGSKETALDKMRKKFSHS